MSIPTGSPVYVRLISSVSSNRLLPGTPFEASLDAPHEINGIVIAERGAQVEGRISESDAAGKISGQSRLALQLTRLMTADGKTLAIQTNTISMAGGTSYGKDAAKIAGIAGVGLGLGALNSGRGSGFGLGAQQPWQIDDHSQRNPPGIPPHRPGHLHHLVTKILITQSKRASRKGRPFAIS